MGTPQPFQILKMDRARGNIVVSRRAVLEESRAEARSELVANLKEGQVLNGVVKNITDYGAFVDLGGVDGLLHVTDIAWKRINHPSEMLQIGQQVNVQVIRFNAETQRISLGMKQLESDPWEGVVAKYPAGLKMKGRVTNITDYGRVRRTGTRHRRFGACVRNVVDEKERHIPARSCRKARKSKSSCWKSTCRKRRISLGIKQCMENPWAQFRASHAIGSTLTGEIRNITEFGLFVGLPGDIDGMVHMSDLSWDLTGEEAIKNFQKGQNVEVKVLDIDSEKERISLGVKQLSEDPFEGVSVNFKKGDIVTCTVSLVQENGIEVTLGDARGRIHRLYQARGSGT